MATKELSNERLKAHINTLGKAGNLNAPPGSLSWAIAVRLELQSTLHDITFDAQQLKAWSNLMREYAGYSQLVNEDGKPFKSYEDFCAAKPPFGLGSNALHIDKIIKELSSEQEQQENQEKLPLKYGGKPDSHLERFSKVFLACTDSKAINVLKIKQVLNLGQSKSYLWMKRWLDLGWLESLNNQRNGYYKITQEGQYVVNKWLKNQSSTKKDKADQELWLIIPRHHPEKASQKLIQQIETEKLKEIYKLIGESLDL
ncbi:hypothetical protein NO108_00663 [Planktothrix rubescens]|nr:hypothetical protein NO108_00663 [Planktothrix rubescens]